MLTDCSETETSLMVFDHKPLPSPFFLIQKSFLDGDEKNLNTFPMCTHLC